MESPLSTNALSSPQLVLPTGKALEEISLNSAQIESTVQDIISELALFFIREFPVPGHTYSVTSNLEYHPETDGDTVRVTLNLATPPSVSQLFLTESSYLDRVKARLVELLTSTEFHISGPLQANYNYSSIKFIFKLRKADKVVPAECRGRCPVPGDVISLPRDPTSPAYRTYDREYSSSIPIYKYETSTKDAFLDSKTGQPIFGSFVTKLGEGAYGNVYLYDSPRVAIKTFYTKAAGNTELSSNTMREIAIMRRLRHPLIVEIKGLLLPDKVSGETGDEYLVGLVMPAMDGDLSDNIKKFSRQNNRKALKYCYQVVAGVAYLHSRDVIHRDLTPRNILYDSSSDSLAIADFGLSRALACPYGEALTREVIALAYRPPEILLGGTYYTKSDVWSVGVILYFILTGRKLFPGSSDHDMVRLIADLLGLPSAASWEQLQKVTAGGVKLPIKTVSLVRSRAGSRPSVKDILDLDTPRMQWSSILLPALKVNPVERATIFELLNNPIFNSVRDPGLESTYINCLDNLYMRNQPIFDFPPENIYDSAIDINWKMRVILVDWLLEVARMFKLRRETYCMTIYLLDSYIDPRIRIDKLQGFGLACMAVSASYLEIYAPEISDYVYISNNTYTREQIIEFSLNLLEKTGYDLVSATQIDFLREFNKSVWSKAVGLTESEKEELYRISQGVLYQSLLLTNSATQDASHGALQSIYYAILYWNSTSDKTVVYPFEHLLPSLRIPSFKDARIYRPKSSIQSAVKYFKAKTQGGLDLNAIFLKLLEISK